MKWVTIVDAHACGHPLQMYAGNALPCATCSDVPVWQIPLRQQVKGFSRAAEVIARHATPNVIGFIRMRAVGIGRATEVWLWTGEHPEP